MKRFPSLAIGLAMFAMFFGAGNVIFPLALGKFAADNYLYGTLGLILTGVLVPLAGVFAITLFDGNMKAFFSQIGKFPGLILALFIITLLGPLGSTPRCIALSYSTFKTLLPDLSLFWFNLSAVTIIFLFAFRKNKLLSLLGVFLTPVLLLSLLTIVILGFLAPSEVLVNDSAKWDLFIVGLKEGYNTMDLLAAFFFSSTVFSLIAKADNKTSLTLKASLIAAILLSLIYTGFAALAAFHGNLFSLPSDQLLGAITFHLAGTYGTILMCLSVGLACLTTAIALISIFSDFVQKELFKEKISYSLTLALALLLTFFVSILEFQGISAFLGPILEICYPGLIVLTFSNILFKFKKATFVN